MQFSECERRLQKKNQSKQPAGRSSSLAAFAGFCGAIPVGLCLWIPIAILSGNASQQLKLDVSAILWVLISALPLIPFLMSTAFIDPRDWPRVLGLIFLGMGVGGSSAILFIFAIFLILPAVVLGLVLGLVKLVPCWWKGDAAGRALALLGITPAALYFFFLIGEVTVHNPQGDPPLGIPLDAHQTQYLLASLLLMIHLLIVAWVALRIRAGLNAKRFVDSLDEVA